MPKSTVADVRFSRFPKMIGVCENDLPPILAALNEATERLLLASGDTGWYGCWKKAVFNVSVSNPYITLPRQFARIINLDVCRHPIRMYNEFFEYLPNGIGLQQPCGADWCGTIQGFERGTVPTMVDLSPAPQFIRVYITDARDVGKRILITGTDQNGNQIYSVDGTNNVNGLFITFAQPFANSLFTFNEIQSIQKDVTYGNVIVKQVDALGVEVTLANLAPTETNPCYRRFYISHLPTGCCPSPTGYVTVSALVKLEFIPVYSDTDQLIISNIPALIEEAQALRYSSMDVPNAALLEQKHHNKAIKLLQNEQRHQFGEQVISVIQDPFEGAPLRSQMIGYLT